LSDQPYETSYGKPPKDRQFRKGRSGNPKGRPKGAKNFTTIFHDVGRQKIKVTDNGVTREITKFEASAIQLLNKAASGDMRALNTLVHWVRMFQEVVDDTEKLAPLATEDDRAVMASILQRIREIDPKKEENEE
jgi:Family of unknown function (DUF5681)